MQACELVGLQFGKFLVERLVDEDFQLFGMAKQLVEHILADVVSEAVVDKLGGLVEDVSEDAVVYLALVGLDGFLQSEHVGKIEQKGASQVAVDGRW